MAKRITLDHVNAYYGGFHAIDDLSMVIEERSITAVAKTAGVIRDVVLSRLGTSHHKDHLKRPMRLVIVEAIDRDGKTNELWLITDRLDLDADLVALAYRYRWSVELFFRWLKCILGCRHLISECESGVAMQVYAALIATLLIAARTGLRPTKRTFEMMCHYLAGWATEEELDAHIEARRAKEAPS